MPCLREHILVVRKVAMDHRRRKGIRDVAIMRASQLDASRLDNELTAMLKEHFMRIFGLFQPVS
jgi:hypothetical protein